MNLSGKQVIVLAEDMYQELELWYPVLRLQGLGATVRVVGTGSSSIYKSKLGYPVNVDAAADQVSAEGIDAIIIPGGYAPDRLRRYPSVLRLVREAAQQGKIVAAICHAGWVLVSAGILKGRKVTSFFAIKDDMTNAGAEWVDAPVVQDGNLITSRMPDDLPAFTDAIAASLGGAEAAGLEQVGESTSAEDALRMAIGAEQAAYDFYRLAVGKTKDPEAKNVFDQLAKDELRHKKIVQDEYDRLIRNPEWERYSVWREVL